MYDVKKLLKDWEDVELDYNGASCGHFAADIGRRAFGAEVEGLTFTSIKGSKKWLKKRGYDSLKDAVTDITGKEPVSAVEANYGDIVALWEPEYKEYCIGVCVGARAYFLSKEGNFIKVPLIKCNYSWSIMNG